MKEKEIPLFYTSCVSTVLIYFNLMTIYSLLVYWDLVAEIFTGKYYALIPMAIIWLFNYFLFVRSEIFLKYNFRKDVKGGIIVAFYIVLTAVSSIVVANYNREKILTHEQEHSIIGQVEQRPSLERKIRKWWRENL